MGGTARGGRGFVVTCVAGLAILGAPAVASAAAPDTEITKGPTGLIASKKATFKFKSTKSGSTFECRLDGGKWKDCESPKRLKRLKQGPHEFEVRARKGKAVDKSPALASFTVDTVAPDSILVSWPDDNVPYYRTLDNTPTFEIDSSEAGSTLECKLQGDFEPCTSPVTYGPLPDDTYTFEVRARDAAGNVDATPNSHTFHVIAPIARDLATAQAAHNYYLPDPLVIDVPSSCGGDPEIDCDANGQPLPPEDQVSIDTTSLNIADVAGIDRFDVTLDATVATLVPIKVKIQGSNCFLTLNSGEGESPTWRGTYSLNFSFDNGDLGEDRIVGSNVSVSGIEDEDFTVTGDFVCGFAPIGASFVQGQVADLIENGMVHLCGAPGPDPLAPCPPFPGR